MHLAAVSPHATVSASPDWAPGTSFATFYYKAPVRDGYVRYGYHQSAPVAAGASLADAIAAARLASAKTGAGVAAQVHAVLQGTDGAYWVAPLFDEPIGGAALTLRTRRREELYVTRVHRDVRALVTEGWLRRF